MAIGDKFAMSGGFWDFIGSLNDNFGSLGYLIIVIFAVCWIVSQLVYHARGYDKIVVTVSTSAH